MKRLEDKVAVITGAASGMGAAEARLFAKEGAKVIATDIQVDELETVVEEITDEGGEAFAMEHDVTNKDDWEKVVGKVVDSWPPITFGLIPSIPGS